VCGTKFGRIYLAALKLPNLPFELAGILAQGSVRSSACAKFYGIPLYTSPEQLPSDIDIACVVVGSSLNGGRGVELALALMARGIHVLQEHPLHPNEIVECLRQARRYRVVYRVNTHDIHIAPVRRFLAVTHALLHRQRPVFVDAATSFQKSYTLLDILGRALGALRPSSFELSPNHRSSSPQIPEQGNPFQALAGVLAGVPLTLRVQNQIDPREPDNYSHLFHRITIGTESGNIILLDTHGPTLWCPRPHMPSDVTNAVLMNESSDPRLTFPTATIIGPPNAPDYRQILESVWPQGVARALGEIAHSITTGADLVATGQYDLVLSQLWHDLTTRLGPVSLIQGKPPVALSVEDLIANLPAEFLS
jgi:pyochelin biosynthesis protein PchG